MKPLKLIELLEGETELCTLSLNFIKESRECERRLNSINAPLTN